MWDRVALDDHIIGLLAQRVLNTSTRSQNRATRIAAERGHNRQARHAYAGPAPPVRCDDEPPAFLTRLHHRRANSLTRTAARVDVP